MSHTIEKLTPAWVQREACRIPLFPSFDVEGLPCSNFLPSSCGQQYVIPADAVEILRAATGLAKLFKWHLIWPQDIPFLLSMVFVFDKQPISLHGPRALTCNVHNFQTEPPKGRPDLWPLCMPLQAPWPPSVRKLRLGPCLAWMFEQQAAQCCSYNLADEDTTERPGGRRLVLPCAASADNVVSRNHASGHRNIGSAMLELGVATRARRSASVERERES